MPSLARLAIVLAAVCLASLPAFAEDPVTLRLMTYNIHHAEGVDGKFDLGRIARLIKAEKPDLVAVQEVDVKTRRASGADQAAKLAELTGMHYAFGKFMDYSGGEYGQMVLSRFPIKASKNHPLPPGTEPRTAMEIRVEVPFHGGEKRELVFVGNHLYATAPQRLAQAKRLVGLYAEERAPVILAGDFNSLPLDPPMALLGEIWTDPTLMDDGKTWPSGRPGMEIDYILYRPAAAFRFVSSKVGTEKVASDHRSVVTVLEWLR